MPSKTNKPKVSLAAQSVQRSNPNRKFRIGGSEVNGDAVLGKFIDQTTKYVKAKIRSLMGTRKNHQIRNQCVIENVQPIIWSILKGKLKKTRATRAGKKIYVLNTKEEASKCLLFENFTFEHSGVNGKGEARIYEWNFYEEEFVKESYSNTKWARLMSNASRVSRGEPKKTRWPKDFQKNPTLIYDCEKNQLKIQFDFMSIDPNDPERRLFA